MKDACVAQGVSPCYDKPMKKLFRSFPPFSSALRPLVAGLVAVSMLGAGCTKIQSAETQALSKPITLNMWGVIDDRNAYNDAINAYRTQYPNVNINFRRLSLDEYESEMLNGFAEDRGPDIFLIHHDWTAKYLSKIAPMPASARVAQRTVEGSVKKEVVWNAVTVPLMSKGEYKSQFVDTVYRDTVRTVPGANGKPADTAIVGIPTFVDTLALYYNRSLLNVAGIPLPPENWTDFQTDVRKLTRRDATDPAIILQSGAAIGYGSNVERSPDLLAALMTQNGAVMTSPNGSPTFQMIPDGAERAQESPAVGALRFYADFADPTKDVYTWNADQDNSLEAFIQGKTAFFFGYAYQQDVIKARAPQLNLGITKLPQLPGRDTKNVANYWFWTVSKKSANTDHAWNFLNFLAKNQQQASIAKVTQRPSPRLDVLSEQLRDDKIGVFASQVLTSKTWYLGRDPKAMEQAFIGLMDRIAKKEANYLDALNFAVQQVGQTY